MKGKHTDDDGDLTMFASGGEVLIACNRGHYWLLKAEQQELPQTEAAMKELHMSDVMTEKLMSYVERTD